MTKDPEVRGKKTSAKPMLLDNVIWICWSVGINRTEWRTTDNRCAVARNLNRSTYRAVVDDQQMTAVFRNQDRAMKAAVSLRATRDASLGG